MRAFRLAYDGTEFHGFQRQPDVPTVEDALFDALVALDVLEPGDPGARSRPAPEGYAAAGRTDAGVSALAQTVAFEAPAWLTPAALNAELPASVRAWARATVSADFHATHDATRRRYRYHLHAPAADPSLAERVLDDLAGEHDVHNLTPDDRGTRRELHTAVTVDGPFLVIEFAAGGFPREFVRRAASLVDLVATGERPPSVVDRVLAAEPLEGPEGIPAAPPEPLVLVDVTYPAATFEADALSDARATFRERRVAAETRARAFGAIEDGVDGPHDGVNGPRDGVDGPHDSDD